MIRPRTNVSRPNLRRLIRSTALVRVLFVLAITAALPITAFCQTTTEAATDETAAAPSTSQPTTAPVSSAVTIAPAPIDLMLRIISPETGQPALADAVTLVRMGELNPEAVTMVMKIIDTKNNIAAKLMICSAMAQVNSSQPTYKAPLIAMLRQAEPSIQKAADGALANYTDADAQAAREAYRNQQERLLMVEALRHNMKKRYELTPEVDRPALLQEWLSSPLPMQQLEAMRFVQEAPDKRKRPDENVLQQIRTLLNSTDADVRYRAIIVLRDCMLSTDAPGIESLLKSPQPDRVRAAIYSALGKLNNPTVFGACVAGLSDPAEDVAAEAAIALGRLAVAPQSPTDEARAAAVQPLLDRANKPMAEATLREAIISAMAALNDATFRPIIARLATIEEPSPIVRQAAIRAIATNGSPTEIEIVVGCLQDSNANVRKTAAQTLITVFRRYLTAGNKDAARALLEKAIDTMPINFADTQALIAKPLIEDYLSIPAVDKALDRANRLHPNAREAVAELFLDRATQLTKNDPQAAEDFLAELDALVPDQFGNGWVAKFNALREILHPKPPEPVQPTTAPATAQAAATPATSAPAQ